ncbi:LysR family transcriptional regulator [Sulfurospirillum arcachonense]|uniref:LysR family transcriptional regulator n=1 Tax=Sulfurospirillum arcachonense TaxID=57666 RepID=UPI00046ADF9C|nr:LysR family transcriptional regulator [Sulfurospirillum arcachonense]
MNIKQLQFILQVVKEQSFTKAAQKLGVSQPYLSQYISHIESQMGILLFDRAITPVKLTNVGEAFCEKAKKILDIYDDMTLELDDYNGIRSGKIVIGITQAGADFIPKVLPIFHKKFPNIEIKVKECKAPKEIESLILNGDIDLGILPLLGSLENLDYQVVEEKRMLLALPIKHPLAKKIKKNSNNLYPYISLKLLKDEQFVLPEKPQQIHLQLDKPFIDAGFEPKIFCTTQSMDVANAIVASGMGICFTLPEIIRNDFADKITLFQIDEKHTLKQMVMAYRKGKYLPKIVKEFLTVSKRILSKKEK